MTTRATTATATTTAATTADTSSDASATIDAFLAAVAAGEGIPVGLYAPDAAVDVTVPGWRSKAHGPEAIIAQYARWFADPGAFEELTRLPLSGGEVVTYLLTWTERGVPHAAHHCHVLTVGDDGLITSDVVLCGGRWPASLLAEMADGR